MEIWGQVDHQGACRRPGYGRRPYGLGVYAEDVEKVWLAEEAEFLQKSPSWHSSLKIVVRIANQFFLRSITGEAVQDEGSEEEKRSPNTITGI